MCRLCDVDIESQFHIMNCVFVRGTNQIIPLEPYLCNIVPLDKLNELQELKDRYTTFQELVTKKSPPQEAQMNPSLDQQPCAQL